MTIAVRNNSGAVLYISFNLLRHMQDNTNCAQCVRILTAKIFDIHKILLRFIWKLTKLVRNFLNEFKIIGHIYKIERKNFVRQN